MNINGNTNLLKSKRLKMPSFTGRPANQRIKAALSSSIPANRTISSFKPVIPITSATEYLRILEAERWASVLAGPDLSTDPDGEIYEKQLLDHVTWLTENDPEYQVGHLRAQYFCQPKEPEEKINMDFVSLGMLILDDIYIGATLKHQNILGGAGTYAAIGARIFCPGDDSKKVGFVAHLGTDIPPSVQAEIESWRSGTVLMETPDRLTTRGKNVYPWTPERPVFRNGEYILERGAPQNEHREFEFISPKVQILSSMLDTNFLLAKSFHLICTPARCMQLVTTTMEKRNSLIESITPGLSARPNSRPVFIWEPMEGSCCPSEREQLCEAMKLIDIFSPNEDELNALYEDDDTNLPEAFRCPELRCLRLIENGKPGFGGRPGCVVLRQGASGCMVIISNSDGATYIPAYHTAVSMLSPEEQLGWENKVLDPTGGGNAFLGGFGVGLFRARGLMEKGLTQFQAAAVYGTVAASFAIEQVGMPKVSYSDDGTELWNGVRAEERVLTMLGRLQHNEGPLLKVVTNEVAAERHDGSV